MIAGRLLVEFGAAPDDAIQAVRQARPGTIETGAQEAYIRRQRPLFDLEERLAPPYVEPPPHEFRDATYDERLEGAIYGLLIGDAHGVPYEVASRGVV